MSKFLINNGQRMKRKSVGFKDTQNIFASALFTSLQSANAHKHLVTAFYCVQTTVKYKFYELFILGQHE